MKAIISLFPAVDVIKPRIVWVIFFFFTFCFNGYAQDNLLKRKVTINTNGKPLESVLLEISDEAQFTFSYDASILAANKKISLSARGESVKSTLDQILPENIDYRVSGNHLILLKKAEQPQGKKEKFTLSGKIYDISSGRPLSDVVVFEISSLFSSITNEKGEFSLSVPAEFEKIGLSFNKVGYEDSIIFFPPKDQNINLSLNAEAELLPAEKLQNLPLNQTASVESVPFVQQIVPSQSLLRTRNTNLVRKKFAQVSFLPLVGTNLKMSGSVANNLSLNMLIGYSYGVDAFELGGLFNIVRKNVIGVQVGGLGNFVGQNTTGFQLGGLFNHNRGSLKGVQIGGLNNMLIDTLRGVQMAGVNNILNGSMKGLQISGINNYTTQNVDGVQFAGLTNLAAEDVRMLQLAGLVNLCENVKGVQFAGLVNVAEKDVRGFQLAGIANWGRNVNAIQFAGIANFSTDTVSGAQLSGIFNYAKYTKSSQIGFINIADSASGIPIGFISIVKKGFHTPEFSTNEIFPVNVTFKTGVKRFYNIFSAGIGNWNGSNRWTFGYGIGSEKTIGEKTFLNFEYTSNWVNEGQNLQKDLSLLNRLNINVGYRPKGKFAITAGPSFNLWLSEWQDSETGEYLTRLAPYTIVEKNWGPTLAQLWIGGKIAVHW